MNQLQKGHKLVSYCNSGLKQIEQINDRLKIFLSSFDADQVRDFIKDIRKLSLNLEFQINDTKDLTEKLLITDYHSSKTRSSKHLRKKNKDIIESDALLLEQIKKRGEAGDIPIIASTKTKNLTDIRKELTPEVDKNLSAEDVESAFDD